MNHGKLDVPPTGPQANTNERTIPAAGQSWLSTADLAEWLGVPPSTLRQWRHKGRGPCYYRLGGHVRYRRSEVDEWIDRHQHGVEESPG